MRPKHTSVRRRSADGGQPSMSGFVRSNWLARYRTAITNKLDPGMPQQENARHCRNDPASGDAGRCTNPARAGEFWTLPLEAAKVVGGEQPVATDEHHTLRSVTCAMGHPRPKVTPGIGAAFAVLQNAHIYQCVTRSLRSPDLSTSQSCNKRMKRTNPVPFLPLMLSVRYICDGVNYMH